MREHGWGGGAGGATARFYTKKNGKMAKARKPSWKYTQVTKSGRCKHKTHTKRTSCLVIMTDALNRRRHEPGGSATQRNAPYRTAPQRKQYTAQANKQVAFGVRTISGHKKKNRSGTTREDDQTWRAQSRPKRSRVCVCVVQLPAQHAHYKLPKPPPFFSTKQACLK